MSVFKKIKIAAIIPETKDAKTFVLESDQPIDYRAGQFLSFIFQKPDREERRSYSFSSSPEIGEPAAITVKRVVNGEYSRMFIDNTRVGDIFASISPSGFFTLPEDHHQYKQIFFLAAGSGITPIFSLIKAALHTHPEWQVVLIYSNHSKKDIIFHARLDELAAKFPERLRIEYLVSISRNLARARLSKWLLSVLLSEYSVAAMPETLFYLCGPFDYMRMATIQLLNEGVPVSNIHKENFSTFKTEIKAEPPDKKKHAVEILFDKHSYLLETQYPQTILAAAKKKGIPIPYSCEAGKCGTCAAICLEGKVWMSYNEVLMDDEIGKGRVLTCVGYPIGGDVKLQF
jgi:ring-1,2-phenylacetyl-CoA epoxidase subunit PaaE